MKTKSFRVVHSSNRGVIASNGDGKYLSFPVFGNTIIEHETIGDACAEICRGCRVSEMYKMVLRSASTEYFRIFDIEKGLQYE